MKAINLTGLAFNFIGAILLWKFVDPSPFKSVNGKAIAITSQTVDETLNKLPRNKIMTKIGLTLISIGFLLQFVAAT